MNEYGGFSSQVGIPQIMVFRPTMEEFRDFNKYITYMESCGAHKAGLAKVIPPSEWKPVSQDYDKFDDMIIPAPISQMVSGKSGIYTQFNIQKKPMTVREFKKLAHSEKHRTPHFSDYDDLERKYWANILYNQAIYGADISGSLYDPHISEWNINRLGTILDDIRRDSSIRIEGVNTAYLYFGMWKTSFAWHTEDIDLYSINYLHFGAPKSWYCIPPQFGRRLERLASNYFAATARNCRAFLRHKMTLISPLILKKYSIPFNKVTQEPGEFMITFPYGYHQGYNHGYNCAESTNFASIRWVEYGKRASLCTCSPDMVRIGMDPFVEKYQPERWELWKAGLDLGPHPEDGPAYKAYSDHVINELLPKWLATRDKNQPNEKSTTLQVSKPTTTIHQNNGADKRLPAKIYKSKRLPAYPKSAAPSQHGGHGGGGGGIIDDRKCGGKPVKRARKDTIFASPRLIAGQHKDRTFALLQGTGEEEPECPPFLGHYVSSSILRPPRLLLLGGGGGIHPSEPVNTRPEESNMAADPGPAVRHICFPENFERPIPEIPSAPAALPSPLLKVIDLDRVSSMEIIAPNPSSSGGGVTPKISGHNGISKCNVVARSTDVNLFAQTLSRHPIIRAKYFCPASPRCDTQDAQHLRKYNFEFGWGDAWCAICQILKPRTVKNLNKQPTNSIAPNIPVNHPETPSLQTPTPLKTKTLDEEEEVIVLGETRSSDLKFLLAPNDQNVLPNSPMMSAAPASCDILMPEICFVIKKAPTTTLGPVDGGELLLPEVGSVKGDSHVMGSGGEATHQSPSSVGQQLLTCTSCKVRIHAACYGVGELTQAEEWLCDPCQSHALSAALCLLCGCRGGALKATSDRSSWCHVTCALATPGVHFSHVSTRNLVTVSLGARDEGNHPCHYCRYVTTMTSSPPLPAATEEGLTVRCCRCPLRFHVTCGWGAGALFEIRDWPHPPLGIACHAHSSPHDHVEARVHVAGEMVYAKHKNARYYRAKVVDRQKEEYYKFEFEDGTFCDNGLPQDIENYDCILNGPPAVGAKVMVRWTDGQVYSAIFKGSNTNTFYMVEFEDGSQSILKSHFLYGLDEDIPKKIRNKISEASVPRKYNSFFDQTLEGPNQKKKTLNVSKK